MISIAHSPLQGGTRVGPTIAITKFLACFSNPNSFATAREQQYETAVMKTNKIGIMASSTNFESVS